MKSFTSTKILSLSLPLRRRRLRGRGGLMGDKLAVFRVAAELDGFDFVRRIALLAHPIPIGEPGSTAIPYQGTPPPVPRFVARALSSRFTSSRSAWRERMSEWNDLHESVAEGPSKNASPGCA